MTGVEEEVMNRQSVGWFENIHTSKIFTNLKKKYIYLPNFIYFLIVIATGKVQSLCLVVWLRFVVVSRYCYQTCFLRLCTHVTFRLAEGKVI